MEHEAGRALEGTVAAVPRGSAGAYGPIDGSSSASENDTPPSVERANPRPFGDAKSCRRTSGTSGRRRRRPRWRCRIPGRTRDPGRDRHRLGEGLARVGGTAEQDAVLTEAGETRPAHLHVPVVTASRPIDLEHRLVLEDALEVARRRPAPDDPRPLIVDGVAAGVGIVRYVATYTSPLIAPPRLKAMPPTNRLPRCRTRRSGRPRPCRCDNGDSIPSGDVSCG